MNSYNNLDLDIIKNTIGEYTPILEAKEYINDEEVVFNPLLIRKKLQETSEALKLLNENNDISFDGIYNCNDLLIKADKGFLLNGIELRNLLVFHNHCERIVKIFNKLEGEMSIRDYTDSINLNNRVFDKVSQCIDNSGEVKDDASDRLAELNRQITSAETDLYNRAHRFIDKHGTSLQEPSFYIRNDRLTFLIKNSDKNKYQGYTYGSSASGLAYYVEPASFIEANNHLLDLKGEKTDEVERILRELSYLIASIAEDYSLNFDSLLKLSVIFAKARYGFYKQGICASLNDTKYFAFKDLCHPLIDPKKVVSNSYRLYPPYQGIVISGSNTGGKTVSLKAIGLSILMSYLGIPIIASDASLPLYDQIYVDIDDNQSIQDSLSTFSAHISNINHILNNADEKSLILIDELISGTDPKEAQAISLAILDKIKQLCSIFIITTHFDDIKNYSYNDPEILLSSVGFNMDTLTPTYRYLEDSIGSSNAIEIASRYFDDQAIIESAKRYINLNRTKEEELLEKLSRQIEENETIKEDLNSEKQKFDYLKNEYDQKIKSFEEEKNKLKDKYLKELNEYIEEIKYQAEEKLEKLNEKDSDEVIREFDSFKQEKEVKKEEKVEFKVNDNVRIKDNEQIGVISEINKDTAIVDVRGLRVKTKLKDLILMPKIKKQETKVVAKAYKRIPSELNIVGERVEDGLVMMEEYLDKANAAHMSNVKIIHGIGTGTLRSAIRSRLKKLSYVKEFKDGDYYDGGSAVTMVEFK